MLSDTYVMLVLLMREVSCKRSMVIELNSKFIQPEVRNEGSWLIEFYAPWCGHCKQFSTTYEHIADRLHGSPIKVAKVDATKYTDVAKEFGISGFPTVILVKQSNVYFYHGARTKLDVIDFAYRALGPALRHLDSEDKLEDAREKHFEGHFFLYVGEENGDLWDTYSSVATKRIADSYFYYMSKERLPKSVPLESIPTVVVFKDDNYYWLNESNKKPSLDSLDKWVMSERLLLFPEILNGNLHEFTFPGKNIVILVIQKNLIGKMVKAERKVFDRMNEIAENNRKMHKDAFQFGWVDGSELVNTIVMHFVNIPGLVVLNSKTYQYYELRGNLTEMETNDIQLFLDSIIDGTAVAYGGNSIFHRIQRMFFEIYSTLIKMFTHQPLVSCVLLGLPTMILSFICYNICCAEVYDDEQEAEMEDERLEREEIYKNHEKQE
ncbi:PREDICTED: protein disulfide-isomerase TMX3-like [Priapulus caudatus]|uniref:Protein disulfide-isomerase TMX3-like n=1 Tax=Priapulus caudatus TaxID=37621 RepID=A0ABM1EDH7_PRICU|nr:PREDICTED: protein disulfide-isomerase TMX3-like [Priapulus caudatus]